MISLLPWLAQAGDVGGVDRAAEHSASLDFEYIIIIGATLLVTAGVFIWAAFFRKRRRRTHYHYRHRPPAPAPAEKGAPVEPKRSSSHRRHRHRRRHRDRPLNPTLAQTGGLPPLRSDRADPPASAD